LNILGLMRVRDERRWIERCVRSLLPLCSNVLVFDDHSTDGTPEICERIERVRVVRSPFNDGINETRDKQFMLNAAAVYKPSWCALIDGDEVLEDGGAEIIRRDCETAPPGAVSLSLPIVYLWDSDTQYRCDGVYARFSRPSVFRYIPGAQFKATTNGGNFHCGSTPKGYKPYPCGARLLHLGYRDKADRIRKYEFYNRVDPRNVVENEYKHIVVGDLFPADARFKWGGPLEVRAL
jgi:glycosyltransferase involved in cell wall biosynthesis